MTEESRTLPAAFTELAWAQATVAQQDVEGAGQTALAAAVAFCCQKLRVDQPTLAARLAERDGPAWACFGDQLIRQAAAQLGAMHEPLVAAYIDEYDASPEDLCFGEAARIPPPLLILHVSDKTAALDELVRDLDAALVRGCHNLIGRPAIRHVLDAHAVTDADIAKRAGYGALITSIHTPALQIWSR